MRFILCCHCPSVLGSAGGAVPPLSDLAEPRRRRALALDKYRKKRNNLRFAKTIRYESRKQLAASRPRVKGQFVKHHAGEEGGCAGGEDGRAPLGRSRSNLGGGNEDDMDEEEEEEEMAAAHREEEAQARYGGQNFNVSCDRAPLCDFHAAALPNYDNVPIRRTLSSP